MRAPNKRWLGLALGVFLAAAGCGSGSSCTDKGGTCTLGGVCPAGSRLPTSAQLAAAGVDSNAYACPFVMDSGTTDSPTCCLPTPTAK